MERAVGAHGLFVPMTWAVGPCWYRTRRWRWEKTFAVMIPTAWPQAGMNGAMRSPPDPEINSETHTRPAGERRPYIYAFS